MIFYKNLNFYTTLYLNNYIFNLQKINQNVLIQNPQLGLMEIRKEIVEQKIKN